MKKIFPTCSKFPADVTIWSDGVTDPLALGLFLLCQAAESWHRIVTLHGSYPCDIQGLWEVYVKDFFFHISLPVFRILYPFFCFVGGYICLTTAINNFEEIDLFMTQKYLMVITYLF